MPKPESSDSQMKIFLGKFQKIIFSEWVAAVLSSAAVGGSPFLAPSLHFSRILVEQKTPLPPLRHWEIFHKSRISDVVVVVLLPSFCLSVLPFFLCLLLEILFYL